MLAADLDEGANLVHAVGRRRGLLGVGEVRGQSWQDAQQRGVAGAFFDGFVAVAVATVKQAVDADDAQGKHRAQEPKDRGELDAAVVGGRDGRELGGQDFDAAELALQVLVPSFIFHHAAQLLEVRLLVRDVLLERGHFLDLARKVAALCERVAELAFEAGATAQQRVGAFHARRALSDG